MQQVSVRSFKPQDAKQWDSYVDNHPSGSFFHLTGWITVIKEVFGHKPHYLVATQQQEIVGVLPLVQQKSMLFGHSLVSTPFCVYGGVIANDDEIRHALEQAAYDKGVALGVDYVELRDKEPTESTSVWQTHSNHATFFAEIPEDPEQILTSIKRKQRAVIRHSQKNSLSWSNDNDISQCYDLYAESVRNLGTPVFSKKLFKTLLDVFPESSETLVIKDAQGEPVSSVLSFYYKDEVLPYYGGGNLSARGLKSNDFMYFQLMHLAHQKGMNRFDFGRSKLDSGAYKYKKNWGMTEQPLNYKIALIKATELPNLSPNNPKYKLLIDTWKKLPLPVSKAIGPHISKFLG